MKKKANPSPNEKYTGSGDALAKIYKKYGLRGVYHGQLITSYREVLGYGIYFVFYEFFLNVLSPGRDKSAKPSNSVALISGASAGYVLWMLTYPIDLIKTRIQLDSLENPKYKNVMSCVRETASTGIKTFYRGFSPVIIRAMPVNGITFAAYELAFDKLNRRKTH